MCGGGGQFSTETVGVEDRQRSDDFILFIMAGQRMEGLCLSHKYPLLICVHQS